MMDLDQIRIEAGYGSASFPMKKGSFQYDDVITEIKPWNGQVEVDTLNDQECRLRLKMEEDFNRIRITFPADARHFYGGGETFSEWDLKGQRIRVWVAEHQNADRIDRKIARQEERGVDPEFKEPFEAYESYYVQPTFITDTKEYVHVDTTAFAAFDFTSEGYVTIELFENAPVYFGKADTFTGLAELLTRRLGRQKCLPDWTHDGMILAIQQGPEVIDQKIRKARKAGVPIAGIWSQDWCGCRRTGFGYQVMWNWRYDEELYAGLPEKIREWNKEGIRFLGYINPFMAIEKDIYRYASEHGYCVKDKEGKDYLVTITTFPAAMIDLTNPDAYDWYKGLIKKNLIGLGLSGWMADFGEYLPVDCVLYSGADPWKIHNEWPAIWAKLNREAVLESGKEGEVFFFTRAGYTGTIRESTMMWTGDQHVDWSLDDGLASVIPATLSLAVCGYGLSHSDVGGYTTIGPITRTRELLMRWEEMNAFSPLMRSHEGNRPSLNVQFDDDEELLAHLKRCVDIHVSLKEYLKELERFNEERGIPVMRPLFYHYDEDWTYSESFEYLLGKDLLVAPVIKQGATTRTVHLPEDRWEHVWTGQTYEGETVTVEAPLGHIPVFIRKDSEWYDAIKKGLCAWREEAKA